MRVLHVATELFPLLKIGGLGDVLGALPIEQAQLGIQARVLLPGHAPILDEVRASGAACLGWPGEGRILLGTSPSGIPLYVLDAPALFDHSENPYAENGHGPLRFSVLAKAATWLATVGDGLGWVPDLVHAHDWPAGLVPAYLALGPGPVTPTVMTVHNAAYQGLFPRETFPGLDLPAQAFTPEGLEFHGKVSLLKAGLSYAQKITTVSPRYAAELQLPEGGMGLDGVFTQRVEDFQGILNGVDLEVWNPAKDPALAASFDPANMGGRAHNKLALQRELGFAPSAGTPLFAVVSRLDELKGLDLLLEDLGLLMGREAQLVVLGRGDPALEKGFAEASATLAGRMAWVSRHDEALAHRILGGADFLVMPSRSEPCGLTQMYAMRYGTLPIVRRTGGLADTVKDEIGEPLTAPGANGISFDLATPEALAQALMRACDLFEKQPEFLHRLQQNAMKQDVGWSGPARKYQTLYRSLLTSS